MIPNFCKVFLSCLVLLLSILYSNLIAQDDNVPYQINKDLFDYSNAKTLGLKFAEGLETFTIYSPLNENDNKYNHAVVLYPFKKHLYAQWQSSNKDEDAEDTIVLYSRSKDGETWRKPEVLAPLWKDGIYTSGGWWSYGDTLIAYINVWPKQPSLPKGGYVVYKTSVDGINWSETKKVLDDNLNPINGIFEQDPHLLPNGRIINAIHEQPGLILKPYYTDDSKGLTGWTKGCLHNLSYKKEISRELEPSSFHRSDGSLVMVFRDQASSFKQLASVSNDNGETWSKPTITNIPDSRAKQSAGNLPSGAAYLVNNPSGSKKRIPLTITLSKDGFLFDKSFLIRAGGDNLQPMKFEGKYKRMGYSYPKSVIWKDYLYISYSANKEEIELTRIPIDNLENPCKN